MTILQEKWEVKVIALNWNEPIWSTAAYFDHEPSHDEMVALYERLKERHPLDLNLPTKIEVKKIYIVKPQ